MTDKTYNFSRTCPDDIWQKMTDVEQMELICLSSIGLQLRADGSWYRVTGFDTYAREQDYIDEMIRKYGPQGEPKTDGFLQAMTEWLLGPWKKNIMIYFRRPR